MELKEAIEKIKNVLKLNSKQLQLFDAMCFTKVGMWTGDVNELIRAESKRELALTLRTINENSVDTLTEMFKQNGDNEWITTIAQNL